MGLLAWILLGMLAGVAAKYVAPDPDPGSVFATMVLGVGGSVTGGFIGAVLGLGGVNDLLAGSLVTAALGAGSLLWINRQMKRCTQSPRREREARDGRRRRSAGTP